MNISSNTTSSRVGGMSLASLISWSIAYGFIDIAILGGNILAIAAFVFGNLLKKRTNYFLLSLSVADLMIGAISVPMFMVSFVQHYQGILEEKYRFIYTYVDVFSGFASIFALAVIAMERLYSVTLPSFHRITKRYVYYLSIAMVWFLAAVVAILRIFTVEKIVPMKRFFDALVCSCAISIAVICIAYGGVWFKVKHRNHEMTRKMIEKDKKLAITLAIVTAVFIVTWLPLHLINIVYFHCAKNCDIRAPGLPQVVYFAKFLQYSNSFVNPIIYTYKIPEFRQTIKKIVGINYRLLSSKSK